MYNEEELYLDDMESVYDTTTVSSTNTSTAKKNKSVLKPTDNGRYKMTVTKNNEIIKVICYATNSSNHVYIRNAVTGIIQPHRACSGEQDLYFKVIDASGLGTTTKYPKHLYYSSPEECERHQNRTVSVQTKKKWYEKYLKARVKYSS